MIKRAVMMFSCGLALPVTVALALGASAHPAMAEQVNCSVGSQQVCSVDNTGYYACTHAVGGVCTDSEEVVIDWYWSQTP